MVEQSREPVSFPVTSRLVARHLEHLVRQLEGPFEEELSGLQERSRAKAVMHLQAAASQLAEFADVEWPPRHPDDESAGPPRPRKSTGEMLSDAGLEREPPARGG